MVGCTASPPPLTPSHPHMLTSTPHTFPPSHTHLHHSYCHLAPQTGKIPVTLVVADDVIYLGRENFHHWPLPRLQELPPKETLEPPFSAVEQKDITDIEQIVRICQFVLFSCFYSCIPIPQIMDPDQLCQVVLRFFKEVCWT